MQLLCKIRAHYWSSALMQGRQTFSSFLTLFCLFCLFWLQGCASNLYQPIEPQVLERIRSGPSVEARYYTTTPFNMTTPAGVVLAEYGDGLAYHVVGEFTGSAQLGTNPKKFDPSVLLVSEALSRLKAAGIDVSYTMKTPLALPIPEPTAYRSDRDYILEFSAAWGAHYLPLSWKTYALAVGSSARLVRVSDQAVVWKGRCDQAGYSDERLKLDVSEFTKEGSDTFWKALEVGVINCSQQIVDQITG